MSIKLAFSTVAVPEWTLEKVAEQAKAMGYDGLELRTLGPGGSGLASDPALSEPGKVQAVLRAFGIEPVCLSTSISLSGKGDTAGHQTHLATQQALAMASEIGCRYVRVFAHEIGPGQSQQSVMQRVGARLGPLADKAGELGIELLLENAGSFSIAKPWWWTLNLVEHPMVGLLWNVANAAAAGESASVSVPMLHSRIRLAKVKDARIGEGSGFVPLGEGTVGIQMFIKRLLGVGYRGYLTVEWDRLWLPALQSGEEYLPDAASRIRGWLEQITEAQKDGLSDSTPHAWIAK